MIGAGVFAAFTPAAQTAGNGLLIGLLVAAFVAFCNATSSAQLAAVYPTSGGTYVYGRERLGHWWGFAAGWGFVVGKTASCAAMAMTFAAYAAPAGWERPVAVTAVIVIAAINYIGISRTALATRVLVVIVLVSLAIVVAAGASSGADPAAWSTGLVSSGWYGIFQSAGLLFFAFAGYARVATLGEEVRDPVRTIPLAIVLSLSLVVVVYGIVAVTLLSALGAADVADTPASLDAVVAARGWDWAVPVVRVGAAAASLGALLALMAGIGRTTLAMAREREVPHWLSAVHPKFRVPHRAEVLVAAVVCVLLLFADLRGAIGFSSFGVLLYYFIANLAAFTQPREDRRYPRVLQVFGALACIVLMVTLPAASVLIGCGVLAAGFGLRLLSVRSQRRRT